MRHCRALPACSYDVDDTFSPLLAFYELPERITDDILPRGPNYINIKTDINTYIIY